VELYGEVTRGITVLKMRGSMHEKEIREFNIDHHGMHIGNRFRNVTGILSGALQHVATAEEVQRLDNLFRDDEPTS
jgi:circadian clock protein KaiC